MTWNDEIVKEVREAREKHAAEFDFDTSKICTDVRRRQAVSGREIVSLQPNEKESGTNFPKAA